MNILLLTQEYPADDLAKEFTPVVHFFTKEWVPMGNKVCVINLPSNFPYIYYALARPFRKKIESACGTNIRMYTIRERKYDLDGVHVLRYPLRKMKPHGRFPSKEIQKSIDASNAFCQSFDFVPDIIVGHWSNPVVDTMLGLKQVYNVPTALVMHDPGYDFRSIYKNELKHIFSQIDLWGWRSYPIRREFEKEFGERNNNFMCFSGVPGNYIQNTVSKDFKSIKSFLFVGLLIKRKYPFVLLQALDASKFTDYSLTFVGEGDEANTIQGYLNEHKELKTKVTLCGRITRDEVSKKMNNADVFCMISKDETFGLVYIEAMAAGCITIASKNEGFDGIIEDGVNGFLCEAGNIRELTGILNRINSMTPAELHDISKNAIETASKMTDKQVAMNYLNDMKEMIKK